MGVALESKGLAGQRGDWGALPHGAGRLGKVTERIESGCSISRLPSELLRAISRPGGGNVVFVLGAGCSVESPTNLKTARSLAADCHRQLVLNGVLEDGEVEDPWDLSAVADAVFQKMQSQREVVLQFPPDDFRVAQPNSGYLAMAALLLEGAIADVMTLNFDRAAITALAQLGAGSDVTTLRGPTDHSQLGQRNLIYLHGDIESDADEIILREAQLDGWKGRWQEVVATRVLASPVVVFVGVGTASSLLVETTTRIHGALNTGARAYITDPLPHEDSGLAEALDVPKANYLCMAWGELMDALGERVLEEHRTAIRKACDAVMSERGGDEEDVEDLCARLAALGLLALGRLRAAWMLDDRSYLAFGSMGSPRYFANLVVGIGMLERVSDCVAEFSDEGVVEFRKGSRVTSTLVGFGGGALNRAAVEVKLRRRSDAMKHVPSQPSIGLIAAVEPSATSIATPSDIAIGDQHDDLVRGPAAFRVVGFEELRGNTALVREIFG